MRKLIGLGILLAGCSGVQAPPLPAPEQLICQVVALRNLPEDADLITARDIEALILAVKACKGGAADAGLVAAPPGYGNKVL